MRLALVLMVIAGAALGQDAVVDETIVKACHAEAGPGEDQPSCVGAAARMCQAQPGGDTTLGTTECLMAETAVWTDLMHAAYAAQVEALDEGERNLEAQLAVAQDAWNAYREAECGLRYGYWIDGSIRTIIAAACHLEKTAARTQELRSLGDME
ncbi:lysozyme inhibitor LprI family protein [uncultured Roseovarius sp.]|uniref:lysozyme inhibitor LprI family protein n=1 Tax=uncultured Roseovarius sp. TaxID=293344 RepID=UPI00261E9C0C|nr:lysozyme inhibitor LprI family protein [uncultured Roseovarius sp.]